MPIDDFRVVLIMLTSICMKPKKYFLAALRHVFYN